MQDSGSPRPTVLSVLQDHLRGDRQWARLAGHVPPFALTQLRTSLACRSGELGGRAMRCGACGTEVLRPNSCHLRACSLCGIPRREQWKGQVIGWSLECDHLHVVFTLPHELNALMFEPSGEHGERNRVQLFRQLCQSGIAVLQRVAEREYGCRVGLIATLHTWGQQMNRHVHLHVIMTAGGLSLEDGRWVPIGESDRAMQPAVLAEQFRRSYLRRLSSKLKRGQLAWPGDGGVLMEPAKTLSPAAQELFAEVQAKRWMVDVQGTPEKYRGARGVVNYLSAYVSGAAISNGRIEADGGQHVTIRFKDYRRGCKDTIKLPGTEFVRRYCDHILPHGVYRVRYAGLFSGKGREERLNTCRAALRDYERAAGIRPVPRLAEPEQAPAGNGPDTGPWGAHAGNTCRKCQGRLQETDRIDRDLMPRLMALRDGLLERLERRVPAALETFILLTHAMLAHQDPRTFGFVLRGKELRYAKLLLEEALEQRAAREEGQRAKAGEPAEQAQPPPPAAMEDAWL